LTPTLTDLILTMIIFVFLSFQYRKLNHSLFITPLLLPLLVFSISIVTIINLHRNNIIPTDAFNILILEFSIYLIFIAITPHLISTKYSNISKYITINPFDIQIAKIIFSVSIAISLIYISMFWLTYSSGADRFAFNRNMRSLMLLNSIFSIWSLALSSVLYVKQKNKLFLYFVVVTIILSGLMGARSTPIIYMLIFLFFYFHTNTINVRNYLYIGGIGLLVLFLPTYFMYDHAFEMILNRVYMAADIYLWSFQIGDYTQLSGYYDPLSYVFHQFTSLVGVRGYDFPMGAQILSTANLTVTGSGPNDQMPMLGLLFYGDDIFSVILFTLFFAFLTMVSVIFTFYFFSLTKINLAFRVLVFTLIYPSAVFIFIGVGAYSFNIILAVLGLIIYFTLMFLKDISRVEENKHDK